MKERTFGEYLISLLGTGHDHIVFQPPNRVLSHQDRPHIYIYGVEDIITLDSDAAANLDKLLSQLDRRELFQIEMSADGQQFAVYNASREDK